MTGSIACFKACGLISKLVQSGHEVRVVASKSALNFIGMATLEGLTQQKVIHDLWHEGEAMAHIHWVRWADLIIVAPASAHFINRISQGIGDDLLSTMFLAHDFKKPYLIAPAMNTAMYLHPTTQASLNKLKEMGCEILESASGVLACGEVGFGRLLEVDALEKEIQIRFNQLNTSRNENDFHTKAVSFSQQLKVLVTSGGTSEYIDDVRTISNVSTGATGAKIVDELRMLGYNVVHLRAERSLAPKMTGFSSDEDQTFFTSHDLEKKIQSTLSDKTAIWSIIHLAAVSDYIPDRQNGKMSSDSQINIKWIKNKKIISEFRNYSKSILHLTGFKLTSTMDKNEQIKSVTKLFDQAQPDWVVQNDIQVLNQMRENPELNKNAMPLHLYKNTAHVVDLKNTSELIREWAQEITKLISNKKEK